MTKIQQQMYLSLSALSRNCESHIDEHKSSFNFNKNVIENFIEL